MRIYHSGKRYYENGVTILERYLNVICSVLVVVSTHTECKNDAHSHVCNSTIKSTQRTKDLVIDSVDNDKPSIDINDVNTRSRTASTRTTLRRLHVGKRRCHTCTKVSSNQKTLRYKQMEIFHQCFQYIHPQISLILLNVVSFYNLCNFFCR